MSKADSHVVCGVGRGGGGREEGERERGEEKA